ELLRVARPGGSAEPPAEHDDLGLRVRLAPTAHRVRLLRVAGLLHGITGSCQPPAPVMIRSAWLGPQVFGSYSCMGVADPRTGSTMRHSPSTPSSRANRAASPFMASPRSRS